MKRVIVIGSDFAPSSYPPALRIQYYVRHLPEFGWEPIVVTIDPQYYEWRVDPENEKLLPEHLQVIRTKALPVELTRKIGIGDLGLRTLWQHWRTASRLCKNKEADLVFIPVPPCSPAVLGRLLHELFGVPYVIDYIDPWVTMNYWQLPRAQRPLKRTLSYALSVFLEPFALKKVAHIVGVSKGTTDYVVSRYPWLSESDATEIPYGGEAADFEYVRRNPRRNNIFNRNDGFLHVSYVGRGGSDMVPALTAIFQAVKLGLQRSPSLFSRLRLHFVGTTYAANANGLYWARPIAQQAGLEDYVNEHPGRVSYLDALQILVDSHALLVPGSDQSHYTASKIFPYILARRPLLAVFNEASSVVTVLRETQAGPVVTFDSQCPPTARVEDILNHLEKILSLPAGYQPPVRWEAFESYSARSMTARLGAALDTALDKNNRR